MSLVVTAERAEGDQGVSLAALGQAVERAMQEATQNGVDPATIFPVVRGTAGVRFPVMKKLEITIP